MKSELEKGIVNTYSISESVEDGYKIKEIK